MLKSHRRRRHLYPHCHRFLMFRQRHHRSLAGYCHPHRLLFRLANYLRYPRSRRHRRRGSRGYLLLSPMRLHRLRH